MNIIVKRFYDNHTSTLSYIVYDKVTRDGLVIDPVLDFNAASGELSTRSADLVTDFLKSNEIKLHFILETHVHADHISASFFLKERFDNAKIAIGESIVDVQKHFKKVFNLHDMKTNGCQFDHLLHHGQILEAGSIPIKVLHTPGHTPACCSFLIGDNIFVGDLLFMPDAGTGRCDFPDGSSEQLFNSISEKIYTLPEDTFIYVGHDYQPGGRDLAFKTTVGESKESNIHLDGITVKQDFVAFRNDRDSKLPYPKLLFPSIQINANAGRLPLAEANDISYLKMPLKVSL